MTWITNAKSKFDRLDFVNLKMKEGEYQFTCFRER